MLSNRQVAEQFRNWTLAECKAYRAGALAGLRNKPLSEGFQYDESEDDDSDLTLSYYRGYADAIGSEAEGAEWYDEISDWRISERWWEI